jgi:hypothetical protein
MLTEDKVTGAAGLFRDTMSKRRWMAELKKARLLMGS